MRHHHVMAHGTIAYVRNKRVKLTEEDELQATVISNNTTGAIRIARPCF